MICDLILVSMLGLCTVQSVASAQTASMPAGRGEIQVRHYTSTVSERPQPYAIYLPTDYSASNRYPLYIALHGGSSNGNLFLGVVMGNNLNLKSYRQHLHDHFVPRWQSDWISWRRTALAK
ncbi:MAG: hypothetical protein R3A47_07125 [Polyangiales bacterium]